jgi:cytochrome c oxidase assembly protein subunit 15
MRQPTDSPSTALRLFSKFTCFLTLFLIFLGGLVKSTESGLSVPDWPTTYGYFMFSFPLDQMVGGIKYEHTHRIVASIVGMVTLFLAIWLWRSRCDRWIKNLGVAAFLAVVAQGILGGLTVKFMLPVWISSLHGTLAQTFFLIVISIAYSLSLERQRRQAEPQGSTDRFTRMAIIFSAMIFIQLIIGNLMRHTNSGLAVPDFPTMGGTFIPPLNQAMLDRINAWRFEHNLEMVTMGQIHIHLLHRFWALLIFLKLLYLNSLAYNTCLSRPLIMKTMFWLNAAVLMQIMLGVSTVLSMKEVYTTTLHVTLGAVVLGLSFLLILRSAPLRWQNFLQKATT